MAINWGVAAVRLACAIGVVCFLYLLPAASHATTLTFDFSNTVVVATVTPFSQSVGGVTAAFSSDQDPGGFEVDTSSAVTFSGLVVDTNFGNATLASELIINFSTPVAAISAPFMTDGPGPLSLQAYADAFPPGADPVGSTSVSGTIPPFPAQFPEGSHLFRRQRFQLGLVQRYRRSCFRDRSADRDLADGRSRAAVVWASVAGFAGIGRILLAAPRERDLTLTGPVLTIGDWVGG